MIASRRRGPRRCAAAREALARGRAVHASRRSRRRCAGWSSERGVKPGKVFQPVRVAIAGTTVSPGIFESVALLGTRRDARPDRPGARRACGAMTQSTKPTQRTSLPIHAGVRRSMATVEPPLDLSPPRGRIDHVATASRSHDPSNRPVRRARAAPQRGPRPPADRRVRGARGVPGAGRVAQPGAAAVRGRRAVDRRRRRRRRGRRRARVAVLRLANQVDGPNRGRVDSAVKGVDVLSPAHRPRRSPAARAPSTSSSAPPSGRESPSASACTASRPSAPPTGSPASSATSAATG